MCKTQYNSKYNSVTCCYVVGWKVIITFHLLPRVGSFGSNQLSQKFRSFTSVKDPGRACAAGSGYVHGMRRSIFSKKMGEYLYYAGHYLLCVLFVF